MLFVTKVAKRNEKCSKLARKTSWKGLMEPTLEENKYIEINSYANTIWQRLNGGTKFEVRGELVCFRFAVTTSLGRADDYFSA